MISENVKIGIRFLILVLLQVTIFSNINLLGYLNPFIYILFLIIYPFQKDSFLFILLGFLLGLSIDILSVGAGAHTIACLTLSFIRPALIRFIFGVNANVNVEMLGDVRLDYKLLYIGLMTFIHHFLFYLLAYFDLHSFGAILINTFYTFLFSFILLWVVISFYKK